MTEVLPRPGDLARRSGVTGNTVAIVASLAEFGLHPFGEPRQVYYHAFVCADSNLLGPVGRTNRKLDAPPINVDHFRFAGDASTSRRRRQMAHGEARPKRAFAGVEIRLRSEERRVGKE